MCDEISTYLHNIKKKPYKIIFNTRTCNYCTSSKRLCPKIETKCKIMHSQTIVNYRCISNQRLSYFKMEDNFNFSFSHLVC